MKKYLFVSIICLLCLTMFACRSNEHGTYYPNSSEMQKNFENAGYDVSITTDLDGNISGTLLYATKDDDYIEFYWLNEGKSVSIISEHLDGKYPNSEKLVSIENDSKFGSLVFCGTNAAVEDSGIKIVDVKVDID